MFNSVLDLIEGWTLLERVNFSFHKMTSSPIKVVDIQNYDKGIHQQVAQCTAKFKDGPTNTYCLVEMPGEVTGRYAYPESEITQNAKITGDRIKLKGETGYSFIENVVALNKLFLEQKFSEVNGKWVFSRIKLHEIPNKKIDSIILVFRKSLGTKLTDSSIFINSGDNKIGSIYFTLV